MKYECFGSGSSGNMHVLTSTTGHRLVVDMGFSWPKMKQNLNHDLHNVSFIVSHAHGDHSKGAKDAKREGCRVIDNFTPMQPFMLFGFQVMAFPVLHNVPTVGFLINHPECGVICYITDTDYLPHVFPNVNHWLIEANYCEEIVTDRAFRTGQTFLAERVLRDHLSIDQCEKMLSNQDLRHTENVVLCHLSDGNSNEAEFINRIRRATGKPTFAARAGLQIDFSLWH